MEDLYINKCKSFISFMLSQQQWSGLTQANIDLWLNNFKGLTQSEQELIYKLLTHIIYFSQNDIVDALKIGVFNCLSYNEILKKQISTDFSTSQHSLQNLYNNNKSQTCFVPLLDSGAPHESGNDVCRLLVQQGIVPQERSMFIEQVPPLFKEGIVNTLVIVDDCVGSGNQLRTFWETTQIDVEGTRLSIKDTCQKYGVKVYYLTLFGYTNSIEQLKKEFCELSIVCVRELNDCHRVFNKQSYVWSNEEELKQAFNLIDSLSRNAGIPTLGYNDLDFAFVMHKTIPDWSLPIFWKENSDWNLLLRRKNSND